MSSEGLSRRKFIEAAAGSLITGKEVLAQGLGQKVEAVMTSEVAVGYMHIDKAVSGG